MTVRAVFLIYMVLVGLASGAAIVLAPQVMQFWVKPYFWVLIAVGVFDLAIAALSRRAPVSLLTVESRMIGFFVGIAMLLAIPYLAGSPAQLF